MASAAALPHEQPHQQQQQIVVRLHRHGAADEDDGTWRPFVVHVSVPDKEQEQDANERKEDAAQQQQQQQQHVLLCLDVSGSMDRHAALQRALVASLLRALPPHTTRLSVVLFGTMVRVPVHRVLVDGTETQAVALLRDIGPLRGAGRTNLESALQRLGTLLFDDEHDDEDEPARTLPPSPTAAHVLLVTDGKPNVGMASEAMRQQGFRAPLYGGTRAWCRGNVRLTAVAVGEHCDFAVLQTLAEQLGTLRDSGGVNARNACVCVESASDLDNVVAVFVGYLQTTAVHNVRVRVRAAASAASEHGGGGHYISRCNNDDDPLTNTDASWTTAADANSGPQRLLRTLTCDLGNLSFGETRAVVGWEQTRRQRRANRETGPPLPAMHVLVTFDDDRGGSSSATCAPCPACARASSTSGCGVLRVHVLRVQLASLLRRRIGFSDRRYASIHRALRTLAEHNDGDGGGGSTSTSTSTTETVLGVLEALCPWLVSPPLAARPISAVNNFADARDIAVASQLLMVQRCPTLSSQGAETKHSDDDDDDGGNGRLNCSMQRLMPRCVSAMSQSWYAEHNNNQAGDRRQQQHSMSPGTVPSLPSPLRRARTAVVTIGPSSLLQRGESFLRLDDARAPPGNDEDDDDVQHYQDVDAAVPVVEEEEDEEQQQQTRAFHL